MHSRTDRRFRGAFNLQIVCIGLSFISIVLSLFVLNSRTTPEDARSDILAVTMTAVEVVIALIAIILAAGAVLGFWVVREAAIAAAEREARRVMEDKAADFFREFDRAKGGTPTHQITESTKSNVSVSPERQQQIKKGSEEIDPSEGEL